MSTQCQTNITDQQSQDDRAKQKQSEQVEGTTCQDSIELRGGSGDEKPPFPLAGILVNLLGCLFLSSSMIFIKMVPVDEKANDLQEKITIVMIRGIIMMSLCAATILYQRSTFKIARDEILINFLRALFGSFGIFGAYVSLNYISPGETMALIFCAPFWTCILSHFIFNERFQWIQLVILPCCLLGIVLIADPTLIVHADHLSINHRHHLFGYQKPAVPIDNIGFRNSSSYNLSAVSLNNETTHHLSLIADELEDEEEPVNVNHRLPGIILCLCVSFTVSGSHIVLKLRKSTPVQTTTFWIAIAVIVASGIATAIFGASPIPDTASDWGWLLAMGVSSWLALSCTQWSFYYEKASVLAVVSTAQVAFTFLLSGLFLDEDIYWTSIVGASCIVFVVTLLMLNDWIKATLLARARSAVGKLVTDKKDDSPRDTYSKKDDQKAVVVLEVRDKSC